MVWVKWDDKACDDPHFLRLPRGIRLLHLEALSWSNRYNADGLIPRSVLGRLTDEPDSVGAVAELVTAGLWEEAEDGWRLVWLLDDQLTAEEVERGKARNREKQARSRRHKTGDHSRCEPKYCPASRNRVIASATDGVSNPGSNGTPSRPVPTRPKVEDGEGVRAVPPPAPGGAPAPPDSEMKIAWLRGQIETLDAQAANGEWNPDVRSIAARKATMLRQELDQLAQKAS
jgi:hypothetical protein